MPSHIPNVQAPFERPYATRDERKAFADGLRKMADWVEQTEFPIHHYALEHFMDQVLETYSGWMDDEDFVKRPGMAARLIGGMVEKGTDILDRFTLTRDFGGGVRFRYVIKREEVCEPREVTETEDRLVALDASRDAELAEQIRRLEDERNELEKAVRPVPVTKTVYDCPPALLPAAEETV